MDKNTALKSLTTYKDSDISDDEEDASRKKPVQFTLDSESELISSSESEPSETGRKNSPEEISSDLPESENKTERASLRKKLSKLVSYNEDDLENEEEGEYDEVEDNNGDDSDCEVEFLDVINYDVEKSTAGENMKSLFHDIQVLTPTLPPEPLSRCSKQLQEKMSRLYDRKIRDSLDLNVIIQRKKIYRNPSIYEKLISFCSIDEFGTNYSPVVYDPHVWRKASMYHELARVQREEMKKRLKEKTKLERKVEFVCGSKIIKKDSKKRKSKWDITGINPYPDCATSAPGIVTITTSPSGASKPMVVAVTNLKWKDN